MENSVGAGFLHPIAKKSILVCGIGGPLKDLNDCKLILNRSKAWDSGRGIIRRAPRPLAAINIGLLGVKKVVLRGEGVTASC